MADGHFGEKRKLPEHHEIVEVQIVAGVDRQANRMRQPRRFGVVRERPARRVGPALDKEADANSMGFEAADRLRKTIAFRAGLPARLAGHFSRHNWNERALIGMHLM